MGEQDGQTALMYASANGYTDAMDVLIKGGANLEGRDKFGFTALMVAATTGEAEAIISLLAAGAKLDARDKFGNTALKKAREQKNAEATKVLEDATRGVMTAPAQLAAPAQLKRPAPDDSDETPVKMGKAKVGADGGSADSLAVVSESIAMHLARAREHAQLAQTVLLSFSEAGGDSRLINLSPEDLALLAATNPRRA